MRASLLPLALLLCACSERALGLFDPDDPALLTDGGAASSTADGGRRPPGGLPVAYCERMVVLGDGGQLSLFDPVAITFVDTAKLACPAAGGTNAYSIALDGAGALWASYSSGELFRADAQTGACGAALPLERATPRRFDLSFVPASAGAGERLYTVEVDDQRRGRLARLDPTTLEETPIAELPSSLELATTDAGELWGLTRGQAPRAVAVDTSTGAFTRELRLGGQLGDITGNGVAFSWLRGELYAFLLPSESTTSVFRVNAETGAVERIARRTGRNLISATAARCSP
jgi:hypothetical protein